MSWHVWLLSGAPVDADQFGCGDGMRSGGGFDVAAGRARPETEPLDIQCIQSEMVVMRSGAARRAWPAIAGALEVVHRLRRRRAARRPVLVKRPHVWRDVADRPVIPDPARSVRVSADQGEAAYAVRWLRPGKRRRNIRAVAGEVHRYPTIGHKNGTGQAHGHMPPFSIAKLLSARRVITVPSFALSRASTWCNHLASWLDGRFSRNRRICIGSISSNSSRPVAPSSRGRYITARSSRKSSYPEMPS